MKKLLTVSLVAVMAVSAAHAKIASVEYVKGADVLGLTGTQTVASELGASVVPAIKALQTATGEGKGGVLDKAKDYADEKVKGLADGAVKTNTDAIAAINNAETGVLATAKGYTDGKIAAEVTRSDAYADQAEADAIATAGTNADAMIQLSKAMTDCASKQCALTIENGKLKWEEVQN